jgi:beta-ribofuranosylaminobenzene 5'-phosphate synthase
MIEVRTCARLHLGLLDNNGGQGRLYGSIGVSVDAPQLILNAEAADSLRVEGQETERVSTYAQRFMKCYGVPSGVYINVRESIPPHVGLGSGTQLGLAVGTALARLAGLRLTAAEIALAVERGVHSGIGIATFQHGGFVLDGGHRIYTPQSDHQETDKGNRTAERKTVPPLLFKHPMPRNWFFVLVLPEIKPGISGEKEKEAFLQLPVAPESMVEKISWILLMKMLPALVEKDIVNFGQALSTIQCLVGDCFASAQGGRFAAPVLESLVRFLIDHGAAGAGQSSWGPAIYGLVEGKRKAAKLSREAQAFIDRQGGGRVLCVRPQNHGARVLVRDA